MEEEEEEEEEEEYAYSLLQCVIPEAVKRFRCS